MTETNGSPMVQHLGYMADALKLHSQALPVLCRLAVFCYYMLQSQPVLTVNWAINSIQLEKLIVDEFFPIPPNTQHKISRRKSRFCDHLLDFTILSYLIFFALYWQLIQFSFPVTIRFSNGSISFHFSKEFQMLFRFIQTIHVLTKHRNSFCNGCLFNGLSQSFPYSFHFLNDRSTRAR